MLPPAQQHKQLRTYTDNNKGVGNSTVLAQFLLLVQSSQHLFAKGMDEEYEKFILVTRKHQAERDRLKRLAELNKKKTEPEAEEYYTDISQINTLIEDNLVPAPQKHNKATNSREEDLIRQYGSREAYERIRSMEMSIDQHFRNKCQELRPPFWPVIPINLKPYLNPQK